MSNFGLFWRHAPDSIRNLVLSNINDPYWEADNFLKKYIDIYNSNENWVIDSETGTEKQIISEQEIIEILDIVSALTVLSDSYLKFKETSKLVTYLTGSVKGVFNDLLKTGGAFVMVKPEWAVHVLVNNGIRLGKVLQYINEEGIEGFAKTNDYFFQFTQLENELTQKTKILDKKIPNYMK